MDPESWQYLFGSQEAPVIIAALDPRTAEICTALRSLFAGRRQRLLVVGPPGSGKSLFVAALLAEADQQGVPVRTLTPTTDSESVLQALARGKIGLLAVNRIDELTHGVRSAIIQNRARCSVGLLATAEQLSAATQSVLVDEEDFVASILGLEERSADVVVISQLLWPGICGEQSDLVGNCDDEAILSLCRGPHPRGVSSLRAALTQLADALIASGSMQDGLFRRQVEGHDIDDAVLAVYRAEYAAPASTSARAVIVLEGSTDVTYLMAASECATRAWGWQLLEGCELRAAGKDRSGGANSVWQRLIELRATSAECVGLFDNDKVGRREYSTARDQGLQVELLPAEFDRLRLDHEDRSVEVEDLLGLSVLDRFYDAHPNFNPEEIRWRNGAWRLVPSGQDKAIIAEWTAHEIHIGDCERLVYVLCVLRKRLGLAIPRSDLDGWRAELARGIPEVIAAVLTRLDLDGEARADGGGSTQGQT